MYHSTKRDEHFTEMLCHWGKHGKKPLIVAAVGSETTIEAIRRLEVAGVLAFPSFWQAVKAVDILAQRTEFLRRMESSKSIVSVTNNGHTEPELGLEPGKPLAEDEVKAILRKRGISTPDSVVLTGGELPAEIPFPFPHVVKIRSSDVLHKTELKGVALNITNQEILQKTVEEMRSLFPGKDLLLERMEPGGLEIIVGLIEDSTFGLSLCAELAASWRSYTRMWLFGRFPLIVLMPTACCAT